MTQIYYSISGEEQWVIIDEANSESNVKQLKEFIKHKIVVTRRVTSAYLYCSHGETAEPTNAENSFEIRAYGERGFALYISCTSSDGKLDTMALASCLKLLRFKLSEEQSKGIFDAFDSHATVPYYFKK